MRATYDPTAALFAQRARDARQRDEEVARGRERALEAERRDAVCAGARVAALWLAREETLSLFEGGDAKRVERHVVQCGPGPHWHGRGALTLQLVDGDRDMANDGALVISGSVADIGAWLRARPKFWATARKLLWDPTSCSWASSWSDGMLS